MALKPNTLPKHEPGVFDFDDLQNPRRERLRLQHRIDREHRKRRVLCTKVYDNLLPFSWVRFAATFATYLLLCTNVARTGLGIKDLQAYGVHELDHFSLYGPWNYTVFTSARNGTKLAPVWSYKYSATSISWRAFAMFFELPEFPDCFLYRSVCAEPPGGTFDSLTAFQMIDAVAEASKNYRSNVVETSSRPGFPSEVVLRTQSRFYDRFHHYIAPQMLVFPVWRTHQACMRTTFAFVAAARPFFCDDIWINYNRSCIATDDVCRSVGLIWVHILRRLLTYQLQYPDKTVDLTLLSSHEDIQHNNGGFSHMSRRKLDVASIVRVRECSNVTGACETIFVDDSRYENAVFASSAAEWYNIVAVLRMCGQSYFYVRLIVLFYGCYKARSREDKYRDAGTFRKVYAAWSLFARIPSPSLVYGSPIPVVCYAVAHLIDAPLTYEIIAQHFSVAMGQYKFNGPVFFRLAAT
ncbi:TPA: hypothetical protein N0F65_004812 [Lagenidium giganteum]|uniref:Uncharacterized protein n=1 Tax=Lagenidium giganteum TaxID=4803 RepID=A0AAV2Z938_9STRA|nr:TPA: hypothetical protein N0F65_004812 [Lagenidium giganteum]